MPGLRHAHGLLKLLRTRDSKVGQGRALFLLINAGTQTAGTQAGLSGHAGYAQLLPSLQSLSLTVVIAINIATTCSTIYHVGHHHVYFHSHRGYCHHLHSPCQNLRQHCREKNCSSTSASSINTSRHHCQHQRQDSLVKIRLGDFAA